MAPDDAYTTGGGKLKLKGSKDGRIEKKKKKKSKPKPSEEPSATEADDPKEDTPSAAADRKGDADTGFETALASPSKAACLTEIRDGGRKRDDGTVVVGKTEAEKKHEEQRRKRLHDRLKREGFKTHKERVEELNKYLSSLSEHHDMPKIGPG